MNRSYVCQDFNGHWFLASANLTAALDRETVRGPVNLGVALEIAVGDVWASKDTANRFRVMELLPPREFCPTGRVRVELVGGEERWGNYVWNPASFWNLTRETPVAVAG